MNTRRQKKENVDPIPRIKLCIHAALGDLY